MGGNSSGFNAHRNTARTHLKKINMFFACQNYPLCIRGFVEIFDRTTKLAVSICRNKIPIFVGVPYWEKKQKKNNGAFVLVSMRKIDPDKP